MSAKGNAALSGAAQGASAGAAFGPWGAAIGGVVGGVSGYLGANDNKSAPPADLTAPVPPGGVVGDYGGVMRDPTTGLVTYTNNDIGSGNFELMRNAYLQDLLMGGTGAGASGDLDASIQFQEMLIDRLSNPKSSGSANLDLGKYVGKEFVDENGKLIDFSDPRKLQATNSLAYQEYLRQAQGKGYGKDGFAGWLRDVYNRNIKPKLADFENASKAVSGNEVVSGEALKAAKLKLQQLQVARQQFAGAQTGLANNPFLNYLNKPIDPRYQQDVDRWRGQADTDYEQMQQKATLPFNTDEDWTVAGFDAAGNRLNPDGTIADASADWGRGEYNGPDSGTYQMLDTASAGALGDVLSRQAATEFQNANTGRDQQMASRGLLSSSVNEVARGGDVARLADAQARARLGGLQAYNETVGANNRTAAQQFQDQFNAAMAKAQTGQWRANMQSSRDRELFDRALGIDQTRYGRFNNEFDLKNRLEQQWRNNALQSLGVQGGLEDRMRGMDRQNFTDRMGFSDFLQGQSNNAFNQEMARRGMNMQQTGQGLNVNMQMAGAQTNKNLAEAQMDNSWRTGMEQMAASRDQANSQFFGNLMGNIANAYASRGLGQPTYADTQAVGRIQSTYNNSQIPAYGGGDTYDPSTMAYPKTVGR